LQLLGEDADVDDVVGWHILQVLFAKFHCVSFVRSMLLQRMSIFSSVKYVVY
jgi:hypothetical protein